MVSGSLNEILKIQLSPGTPNNQFKMDGNGETTAFHVKILSHPIETTMYKWMFHDVSGSRTHMSQQFRIVSLILLCFHILPPT